MGPYLTVPKKEKETENGENFRVGIEALTNYYKQVKFGACGMQGWRNTMEDSHICALQLDGNVHFFGVFDGHGGIKNYSYFLLRERGCVMG